jgi:hypothetical protein
VIKRFRDYLIDADDKALRHGEYFNEDSNMPPARDSISPIHGGDEEDNKELDRIKKFIRK